MSQDQFPNTVLCAPFIGQLHRAMSGRQAPMSHDRFPNTVVCAPFIARFDRAMSGWQAQKNARP